MASFIYRMNTPVRTDVASGRRRIYHWPPTRRFPKSSSLTHHPSAARIITVDRGDAAAPNNSNNNDNNDSDNDIVVRFAYLSDGRPV